MADQVKKVKYCHLTVSNRAGHGDRVLGALDRAGVDLQAFTAFPSKAGQAQVDLVAEDLAAVRRVARKHGWRLSKPKKGFLVRGQDRIGAVHRHVHKLAAAKISVTAADAVSAGKGRYGMILWVKPKDYARAARTLGAR